MMSPALGSGETPGGGAAVTVTVDVPLAVPLVAVIVAGPTTRALTSPEEETVATEMLLDVHVIGRPLRTFPFASRVTADSCTVRPAWTLGDAGETETEATGAGGLTVNGAEPVFPSLVATMLAVPAATAVTTPPVVTVAMLVFDDDQTITRPVKTFPFASRVVAVAFAVCPMLRVEFLSATVIGAIGYVGGALTVRGAEPVFPSLVA